MCYSSNCRGINHPTIHNGHVARREEIGSTPQTGTSHSPKHTTLLTPPSLSFFLVRPVQHVKVESCVHALSKGHPLPPSRNPRPPEVKESLGGHRASGSSGAFGVDTGAHPSAGGNPSRDGKGRGGDGERDSSRRVPPGSKVIWKVLCPVVDGVAFFWCCGVTVFLRGVRGCGNPTLLFPLMRFCRSAECSCRRGCGHRAVCRISRRFRDSRALCALLRPESYGVCDMNGL